MDIGKSPSAGSSNKLDAIKVLRMEDLTLFINQIENIINAEMDTLRSHIQKNTSERSKTLDLGTFYDHVASWAEKVWQSRKDPEDEEQDPEPKEEETKKVDSNIQVLLNDSHSLLSELLS